MDDLPQPVPAHERHPSPLFLILIAVAILLAAAAAFALNRGRAVAPGVTQAPDARSLAEDASAAELAGDAKHALGLYQAVLATDPHSVAGHLGLARMKAAEGDTDAALAAAAAAFADATSSSEKAQASAYAGMAHLAAGDAADARPFLGAASELEPSYLVAWLGLGTALHELSIATGTPAAERADLAERSEQALRVAATFADFTAEAAAASPYRLDLSMLGAPTAPLTALKAARGAVSSDSALREADREHLLAGFDALDALVKSIPGTAL
jgi:tetratricopeptide (TPR) repeat protein